MRAVAIALAVLLLAQVAAVEPNQRTSPVLEMDESLTAIAVGGDGRIVVGTSDVGSDEFGDNPNELVWSMWNRIGQLENSGTVDANDCTVDPLDPCTAHVVGIEANNDGRRIVIAGTDDENNGGRLLFLTSPQGQVERVELPGAVTAVAMNPSGSHVAVTMRIVDVLGPDSGRLHVYQWGATVTLGWSTDFDDIPTHVALSGDAQVAFVGSDTHQRVRSSSQTEYNLVTGVRALAASDTAAHWSIAGYQTGDWAVFSDESDTDPFAPVYSQKPTNSAVTAVAMTPDARYWAVGHADGSMRLYANRDLVQPLTETTYMGEDHFAGGVQELQFSSDGRYLLVGAGNKMGFYYIDPTEEDPTTFQGLYNYFYHEHGEAVVGVGLDTAGDQLVVAHGKQATVFNAIHDVDVSPPPAASAVRDGAGSATVTYTNEGNRWVEIRTTIKGSGDWDATVSPTKFGLQPGESRDVVVDVQAPANSTVESRTLQLEHRANGGERIDTDLPFQVNQVHFWAIEPEGSFNSAIQPGQSITFDAKVTNLGNGLDQSELLVTVDEDGWQASVAPDSLSLEPKASSIVQVTMTAPANALDLESGRATLRLSADPTAHMGFTATVGAKYGLQAEATLVNASQAWPGGEAIVEIRLTNAGNSVDMIRLEAPVLPTDWQAKFRNEQSTHFVLDLQPGQTKVEPARIVVAPYDQIVERSITLRATSLGNESISFDFPIDIQVANPPAEPEKNETEPEPVAEPVKEKSPGLPLVALVLAIAVLAMRRRK